MGLDVKTLGILAIMARKCTLGRPQALQGPPGPSAHLLLEHPQDLRISGSQDLSILGSQHLRISES